MTSADLVLTRRGVRFANRVFPCAIGRGGVALNKTEGDGVTPVGVHRITGCLYRPDRMPCPVPWAEPILPNDLWSDDSNDPDYNQLVHAPHDYSHERLRRADPLYDLVLTTNWNWPVATPNLGSAIFIHCWRKPRHPTEGCIAFRPDHLLWIASRIDIGTRVIIA